jgi:hypothetical protein
MASQNFENHTKLVPLFHFFVLPVFVANLIWSVRDLILHVSAGTIRETLLAFAFFLGAGLGRTFALKVQDRIIRLEMRLRLHELLSPELRPRVSEFTVGQLVSLRFASDAELPALARKVLDENIVDRKAIKKMVQNWQPDLLRA